MKAEREDGAFRAGRQRGRRARWGEAPGHRLRERPRWQERKQRRRWSRSQPAIALSPTTTIPREQQAASTVQRCLPRPYTSRPLPSRKSQSLTIGNPTYFLPSQPHSPLVDSRLSRQQLLRNLQVIGPHIPLHFLFTHSLSHLQILGPLPTPLPPTLPPSPPASRSSSPQPPPSSSSKRKSDAASSAGPSKRPRTSEIADVSRSRSSTSQRAAPSSSHHEPCEEGELRDEPLASRAPQLANHDLPVRRPRKNLSSSDPAWPQVRDRYHNAGRVLKYSGELRTYSSYAPTHKAYRPLHAPPPPGSPYLKHSTLIAKLELLDALVTFSYSLFVGDVIGGHPSPSRWDNIEGFMSYVKGAVFNDPNVSDRERALYGIV